MYSSWTSFYNRVGEDFFEVSELPGVMRTLLPFHKCKKGDMESSKMRSSNRLGMSPLEINGCSIAKYLYQL